MIDEGGPKPQNENHKHDGFGAFPALESPIPLRPLLARYLAQRSPLGLHTLHGPSPSRFFDTTLSMAGVPVPLVNHLMRHSRGQSRVAQSYMDPTLTEQAQALEKLPQLWPESGDGRFFRIRGKNP